MKLAAKVIAECLLNTALTSFSPVTLAQTTEAQRPGRT